VSANVCAGIQHVTTADLELANLVYRALGAVDAAGRFGPRKVFISALWVVMLRLDPAAVERLAGGELAQLKRWLVRAQRLIRSERERTALVVLARADLVAAMPRSLVADSETITDGASYHFVLDPNAAPEAYAPRPVSLVGCGRTRQVTELTRRRYRQ
jgi:hypothetical protein